MTDKTFNDGSVKVIGAHGKLPNNLVFGVGNAKLKRDTVTFSLPAGHACPFAKECRSAADRLTGKIKDGEHCKFRCYAANTEALFRNVREGRWRNFEMVKSAGSTLQTAALIDRSIPRRRGKTKLVRFHQSGDFFTQAYFDAWLLVARNNPDLTFYGYTKALSFWVKRLGDIPANFKLVASRGGVHDSLISLFGLRSAKVVFSEAEAAKLNLPIDSDDTHVWQGNGDFAILLHGTQPAGSDAGKAWYKLHKAGHGYRAGYFDHYKKSGKTVSKKVNGKHIHLKPEQVKPAKVKPVIRVHGVQIKPEALKEFNSRLKRVIYGKRKLVRA